MTVRVDPGSAAPSPSPGGDASLDGSQADGSTTQQDEAGEREPRILHLSNLTTCRVLLPVAGGLLVIPPLDTQEVEEASVDVELRTRARLAGILGWQAQANADVSLDSVFRWAGWGLFLGFLAAVWLTQGHADKGTDARALGIAAAVGSAVCLLAACILGLGAVGKLRNVVAALQRAAGRARELLYLGAATVIVLAIPGALLYFGADVKQLYASASDAAASDHDAAVAALGGLAVKAVFIVGASVLPVILYFVFDRVKLRTLRDRFSRDIFRLDPSVSTLADVHAKYGRAMDEVYGRRSDNRLLPGARSPILLAAAVITAGWTVALLDTVLEPSARSAGPTRLSELLAPTPAAATFAFLGAYFFALNTVLRGYVRGDLRPKTYAEIAVRIVGVVILAFLLERLITAMGGSGSAPPLLAVAFLAGIVPETVLVRLQEVVQGSARTGPGRRWLSRLARTYETHPLTDVDGIDIYDRARLNSEGVNNVEGLAHHDVVDLLLKTRIAAPRVVYWVDQSILQLHCSSDEACNGETSSPSGLYSRLREHGIRTATDLEEAYAGALTRCAGESFLHMGGDDAVARELRVLLDAIADEEWMRNLRYWRSSKHDGPPRDLRLPDALDDDPPLAAVVDIADLGPAWQRLSRACSAD